MSKIPEVEDICTPPLLVAECKPDRVLTKRFEADGTKHDFEAGWLFKYHELAADNWPELLDVLTLLTGMPRLCILRAVLHPEYPRDNQGAPADTWYHKRKLDQPDDPACLMPGAFPWCVFDFDETAAPFAVADPETSIQAWHSTLPAELRAASSAFFISSSAHVSPCVRGKLVVWYRRLINERQAQDFASLYGADPSVGRCYQPNFFAAPIFEAGAIDPLAAHRHAPVVFEGKPATQPTPGALKAHRKRPAPVPLGECPAGDRGILAALGPAELQIGKRFHIAGALGGIMRKLMYPRDACAAVLMAWIPAHELAPRLKWAMAAWDKPRDEVSGEAALRAIVGKAHADVIVGACTRAPRFKKVVIK